MAAAERLRTANLSLQIVGTYCPPAFTTIQKSSLTFCVASMSRQADILFVGLGAPMQDYWMFESRDALKVHISRGIGDSFEFIGCIVQGAPMWMRTAGLEWLFRLSSEPRRLWKRYLLGNVAFCRLILAQYIGSKTGKITHGRALAFESTTSSSRSLTKVCKDS
jgi:N-acetylglucosaminyldiphosphoundecaprenol N-acetyl-beta-D-mannosaminyltransferase